ncbi:hypothetical protein AVDCRST_MAG94-3102, partial [uncultured Leptolyngbya sp.]
GRYGRGSCDCSDEGRRSTHSARQMGACRHSTHPDTVAGCLCVRGVLSL